MRLEAAVDSVDGITSAIFSLFALFVVPICAITYCAGGGKSAGREGEPTNSAKSKTVSKSTLTSSAGNGAPVAAVAPTIPDTVDNRPQWATNFLENHTPKSIGAEFKADLKNYVAPERTKIQFEQNLSKNRHDDIPCYDQDRVILKQPSDYIHANYMKAPDGIKYIATQGPLVDTRCDFWQMVVQEEAVIILQLCKFVEGDEEKCAEYWPASEKETTTVLDRFTIRKIDKQEEIAPGTMKTKLRIENKTVNRTVQHIFCDSWPDKLAPSDSTTMIKIWNYVKANRGSGPIVVHCSAGVGRTSSFIALSYGSEMLKKSGTSIMDVVKELRKSRHKAVQTHIQYTFLHAALLELFMQMNIVPRTPKATEFLEAFKKELEKKMEKREKLDKSANSAEVPMK